MPDLCPTTIDKSRCKFEKAIEVNMRIESPKQPLMRKRKDEKTKLFRKFQERRKR